MNKPDRKFTSKLDLKRDRVNMAHGGGGRAMSQLIDELFAKHFANELLLAGNDQAICNLPPGRIAMSTDGYVISPLFFAGGDIGSLAIHGTINDVAMSGAKPLYIAAGFILEEGLALSELEKIVISMAGAAKEAGVAVVTGDTKVVEKGNGDGVFITTTGIGVVPGDLNISGNRAEPGDAIIVNGSLGDHGVVVMSHRANLEFEVDLKSDSAALHTLIADMLQVATDIHCLRDPTRGGLATTLNELAQQSNVGIKLYEDKIPIKPEVNSACELLGLDPLYIANEGKLICVCKAEDADKILTAMQAHPLGRQATVIGEVIADENNFVQMQTTFGGNRVVDWIAGEQLPRIC